MSSNAVACNAFDFLKIFNVILKRSINTGVAANSDGSSMTTVLQLP